MVKQKIEDKKIKDNKKKKEKTMVEGLRGIHSQEVLEMSKNLVGTHEGHQHGTRMDGSHPLSF